MRKYTPIWLQLKNSSNGQCSIAIHKSLHARVIKAVSKEKYMDVAYKLLLAEQGKKVILSSKSEGAKVTFFITIFDYLDLTNF